MRISQSLASYLRGHGFAPHPCNRTWLDHAAGQQIIRVLHEPGEATLLTCLTSRSVCLYEAVFSPGTPDTVLIAAVEAALASAPGRREPAGTGSRAFEAGPPGTEPRQGKR
jgi:hypothetical protein